MVISEPGTISAATSGKAAEDGIARDRDRRGFELGFAGDVDRARAVGQWLDRDLAAERLDHALGVIARRRALDDGRAARNVERREQQRRFHLGRCDLEPVLDRKGRARALERHGQQPAFAGLRHGAEQRQRIEHAAHRPAPQRRIAGEDRGDGDGRDRAHGEADAGAGIAEIEHVGRLAKPADADAMDAPFALALARDIGAEPAHRFGGVEHVIGFEQAGDLRLAHGEGAQDERAVRHGFVAGRGHPAL